MNRTLGRFRRRLSDELAARRTSYSAGVDLDGLDGAQHDAVTNTSIPLAIIAPAGSGKTRVLTRRIAHRLDTGAADPGHVLALTFTRKAATELLARLGALGVREHVTAGTFHAVAWQSIQRHWEDQRRRVPAMLEHPETLLAEITGRHGPRPGDVARDIAWAQARLVDPDRYESACLAEGRRSGARPEVVAELYRNYEATKRSRRLVDFSDLLTIATEALHNDRLFGDVERWRHRHFFVDEFQDLNPAQHALLEAWRNGRADLCAVGDPNQAIYGWNGADAGFLANFGEWCPGATVVHLDMNYRTPATILDAATRALDVPLAISTHPGEQPVQLHRFSDEFDEAAGVSEMLRAARRVHRRWSSLAVLARTNNQLSALAQLLDATGIPCSLRRDVSAAFDMRRWWTERRSLPLRSVIEELTAATVDPEFADEERWQPHVRHGASLPGYDPATVELAMDFARARPDATVAQFLPTLATRIDDGDFRHDAVQLLTFHAAKGLEWPTVVIIGAEESLVPIAGSFGSALEEERRLLYVAMTRARRSLHVTWAATRDGKNRKVCGWLAHLGEEPSPAPPPPRPDRAMSATHSSTDRARRTRDDAGNRLRQWRGDAARAGRADPRAVLSDEIIEQLLHARPRDLAEVAAVTGAVKAQRFAGGVLDALWSRPDASSDAV
jgi:DNA helicase II / ATP-dependent DNA helicase PcrA